MKGIEHCFLVLFVVKNKVCVRCPKVWPCKSKAALLYLPVAQFVMLYKVVLTLSLWMKSWSVTIQMKATEQYFPVVMFIMLFKVVLSFESVDKILNCDHSVQSS